MKLYKIGLNPKRNASTLLNNGGLFEYNKIKAVLDDIDCDDYICILNGVSKKAYSFPTKKKKIFIATDAFCFDKNKDVIDKCDYVLHQSEQKLDCIHKPQEYSYVPFLFTSNEPQSAIQIPKVIFGGANRGRDDKICKYILHWHEVNPDVVPFLKICNEDQDVIFDNRVNYDDFIKIMRSYKYTICFSRKEYDELKWTTPRYIEAISNYVLPLMDVTYCTHSAFHGLEDIVTSSTNMHALITSMTESERMHKLSLLDHIVNVYKDAFRDTILKIIN